MSPLYQSYNKAMEERSVGARPPVQNNQNTSKINSIVQEIPEFYRNQKPISFTLPTIKKKIEAEQLKNKLDALNKEISFLMSKRPELNAILNTLEDVNSKAMLQERCNVEIQLEAKVREFIFVQKQYKDAQKEINERQVNIFDFSGSDPMITVYS